MGDLTPGPREPLAVLGAHLAAMAAAAAEVEEVLGCWAQEQCSGTVEGAMKADPVRTEWLRSAGRFDEMMSETAQLRALLPDRIASGLRSAAWRHLFVDPNRDGTSEIMADLDYAIWQESGHKIPPAYEPVVRKELERVTQLLRRYGYRPDFRNQVVKRRHTAPPEATASMEAYCRLSLRLGDVVSAAEAQRRRAAREAAAGAWDPE